MSLTELPTWSLRGTGRALIVGAPTGLLGGTVLWLDWGLVWMERGCGWAGDSLRGHFSYRHMGGFWIPSCYCRTEGPGLVTRSPAPQSLLRSQCESWQGLPRQGPPEAAPICAFGPGGWGPRGRGGVMRLEPRAETRQILLP